MRSEERSEYCIVGVGGAGTNIVNRVHASNISGIDCIVANTDFASLRNSPVSRQIQLGNGGRGADGCAAYGSLKDLLRSLRARSTSITCSAFSFASFFKAMSAALSSSGTPVLLAVPAIG